MPINSYEEWRNFQPVREAGAETGDLSADGLCCGDILIKHAFPDAGRHLHTVERLIRMGNAVHVFDYLGSKYSEHVAIVGDVTMAFDGSIQTRPMLFEAVGEGILLRSPRQTKALWRSTNYTVYRMFPSDEDGIRSAASRDSMEAICSGFATRLATIQGLRGVKAVAIADAVQGTVRAAVSWAHAPGSVVQSTRYGFGNMGTSALPNLIPDGWFGKCHGQRALEFIRGDLGEVSYICSALAAVLLEAWSRETEQHRIWVDPAQAHPCMIEHQLSKTASGWGILGRWGRLPKSPQDHDASALVTVADPLREAWESPGGGRALDQP